MTGRSGRRAVRASRVGSRPLRPGAGTSRRAVRAVSCWRWNGGFGAHSGPSSGDPRRRASRPIATSILATSDGSFTSTPAGDRSPPLRLKLPRLKCLESGSDRPHTQTVADHGFPRHIDPLHQNSRPRMRLRARAAEPTHARERVRAAFHAAVPHRCLRGRRG
jgi:hypothetical protein